MLIPWLEELKQNNSISKEAAEAIYKDCSDLIETSIEKTSAMSEDERAMYLLDHGSKALADYDRDARNAALSFKQLENAAEHDKRIAAKYNAQVAIAKMPAQAVEALVGPIGGAVEKGLRPYRISRHTHKADKFLSQAFTDEDIPKAKARFEEITDIAPSLVQDPLAIHQMVASSLHTGLSQDDKNYLRQLQNSESNSMWDMGRIRKTVLKGKEKRLKSSLQKALKKSAMVRADHLATVFELIHEGTQGSEKVAADSADVGKYVAKGLKPSLGNVASNALKTLALVSAVPVIAGGLTGIGKTLVAYKQKKELERNLRESFDYAMGGKDDASRTLRENKDQAKASFESLVHFAPDVASQKGAAKAFMYKMINVGGPEVGMTSGDIKDLTSIQQNMINAKGDHPFVSGFAAAGKLTGLGQITSKTISDTAAPFAQQSSDMASAHLSGPGQVTTVV